MPETKANDEIIIDVQTVSDSKVQESSDQQHEVVQKLQTVESDVGRIKRQNAFGAFFQAGKNARDLAGSLGNLTDVVKWELNMVLLALNAQIKRKEEFDQIMESLDTVEKELQNDVEQKEYLEKVRSAVTGMRERFIQIDKMGKRLSVFKFLLIATLCVAIAALVVTLIAII